MLFRLYCLPRVGVYCIYRAGKQPVRVQTQFMWAVALACFAVAGFWPCRLPVGPSVEVSWPARDCMAHSGFC